MVDYDLASELRKKSEYVVYVVAGRLVIVGLVVAIAGIVGSQLSGAKGFVWAILIGGFIFVLSIITSGTVTYAVFIPTMNNSPGYVNLGDTGWQADFIGTLVGDIFRIRHWRSFG